LSEQQLHPVLIRPRLSHEIADESEHREQERGGEECHGCAAGQSRGADRRDPDGDADRHTGLQREADERHPHSCATGEVGCTLRLQRDKRGTGCAHHRYHRRLQPASARGEPRSDRLSECSRECDERERDTQAAALERGVRPLGNRARHDHNDHDESQRSQRVSLTLHPLLGTFASLNDPPALAV
jgi:hypothetical protein